MAPTPVAGPPAAGPATGDAPAPDSARRRALAALCVTEIVSYGVIYYAFPILATQITAATGWSRTAITLAYSAGSLAGVPAGRFLQRHGPRLVMTAGSVLGALAVAGIAVAPDYGLFVAAWLAAGIASAGLYYPPAFAALTAWYWPRRVAALTTLTLAAGFASTIFAPLTSALAGPLGWRGTYLVLAVVLAAVTIPAHALFLRLPWAQPPASSGQPATGRGADRSVLASRTFLVLVTAATLCAFAQYAALVNLVPLLTGRGMSPALAAWALGLGGAGQVAGRLCYARLAHWLGTRGRTVAIIAAVGATTLLLGLLPGPAALLVAASVLAGAVRGVFTLTEATLVTDYWGPGRYAAAASYPVLFVILAAAAAAGAALAAAAPPPGQPERAADPAREQG